MSEFEEFVATLESLGEDEVRRNLSQGIWANRRKAWAQDWIANLDASQEDSRAETSIALSKEANEIARSSLGVARTAKTISVVAMILSAAVAIAVALAQFFAQR